MYKLATWGEYWPFFFFGIKLGILFSNTFPGKMKGPELSLSSEHQERVWIKQKRNLQEMAGMEQWSTSGSEGLHLLYFLLPCHIRLISRYFLKAPLHLHLLRNFAV